MCFSSQIIGWKSKVGWISRLARAQRFSIPVLATFQLLWKAGEETITIIHPAGDKVMNTFLQILTANKTSNSWNVFEMMVCWFSYCFYMTTKTKVCLQNQHKIFDLIFSCLTPRVKVRIHLENFIFVSKCNDFSLFNRRKFWHIQLLISSMHWQCHEWVLKLHGGARNTGRGDKELLLNTLLRNTEITETGTHTQGRSDINNNPQETWGRTDYMKGDITGNTWDEIKTQTETN